MYEYEPRRTRHRCNSLMTTIQIVSTPGKEADAVLATEDKQLKAIFKRLQDNFKKLKKGKKQEIQRAAKELEDTGKVPINAICLTIVKLLEGMCNGTYVRDCLDKKYKNQTYAGNAKTHTETATKDKDNKVRRTNQKTMREEDLEPGVIYEVPLENIVAYPDSANELDLANAKRLTKEGANQIRLLKREIAGNLIEDINPRDYKIEGISEYTKSLLEKIVLLQHEAIKDLRLKITDASSRATKTINKLKEDLADKTFEADKYRIMHEGWSKEDKAKVEANWNKGHLSEMAGAVAEKSKELEAETQ
jgi:hypothetical protein